MESIMVTLDEMFSGNMFIVGHGKRSGASRELMVRGDGRIYAIDAFTSKWLQAADVSTVYGAIMPSTDGGLELFSDRHKKWIKCSVQNGVYTIDDLLAHVKKYNL